MMMVTTNIPADRDGKRDCAWATIRVSVCRSAFALSNGVVRSDYGLLPAAKRPLDHDVLVVVVVDQPAVAEAAHGLDDRQHGDAFLGQVVLDAGRRLGIAVPLD